MNQCQKKRFGTFKAGAQGALGDLYVVHNERIPWKSQVLNERYSPLLKSNLGCAAIRNDDKNVANLGFHYFLTNEAGDAESSYENTRRYCHCM